jgi:hypothetical protein
MCDDALSWLESDVGRKSDAEVIDGMNYFFAKKDSFLILLFISSSI